MAVVTVIPDGGGQPIEREVSESTFGVYIDGEIYYPAATQSLEVESNGNVEKTGTQCGTKRQQRTSEDPYSITAECIVTLADQSTANALTVRQVLKDITEGEDVRITSAFPIDSALEVSNVLVRQETELISVNTDRTDGEATAFRCQLQLGAEQTE